MQEILDIFIFKEKPSWISDMFLIKRMKDCLKNISEIFLWNNFTIAIEQKPEF